jgi:hypothetical protein
VQRPEGGGTPPRARGEGAAAPSRFPGEFLSGVGEMRPWGILPADKEARLPCGIFYLKGGTVFDRMDVSLCEGSSGLAALWGAGDRDGTVGLAAFRGRRRRGDLPDLPQLASDAEVKKGVLRGYKELEEPNGFIGAIGGTGGSPARLEPTASQQPVRRGRLRVRDLPRAGRAACFIIVKSPASMAFARANVYDRERRFGLR